MKNNCGVNEISRRLREAAAKGKPEGNMMLATNELLEAARLVDEVEQLRAEVAASKCVVTGCGKYDGGEVARLRQEVRDGYDVIAFIIGDDGQRREAVGTRQAANEAITKVNNLKVEHDALRTYVDRLQQQWADNAPAVAYKQECETLRASVQGESLLRGQIAEKNGEIERLLQLLGEARVWVADPRLVRNEMGGRKRYETLQDHADRISTWIQENEDRADLIERIDIALKEHS